MPVAAVFYHDKTKGHNDAPSMIIALSAEIALQQAFESLAMAGFVASHLI